MTIAPPKPRITPFGSSFGAFGGIELTAYDASGGILTDRLNKNEMTDVVEFNKFEKIIYDFVLARLGHPIIRVELTPFQIKTAIDEASSQISYHDPIWARNYAVFDASAGINLYELPLFIAQNLEYVVYKKSLLSIQSQAGTLEFDFFIKYFQDNHLFSDFSVGEFFLLQQHLEMMRKILSQEGTWDLINGRFLQLSPSPVITPQKVILEYRAIDTGTIHPAYINWIQRYALAICKGILGLHRGKFANLPSPGGGATLDGQALRDESRLEKEELMVELVEQIEEPPYFMVF